MSTDARTGVSTSVSRSARTSVTPMGFDYADSVIGPGSVSGSILKSRSMSGRGIALEGKDSSVVRQWLENTPSLET